MLNGEFMRILYITNGYPSSLDLSYWVFSQRLVNEWIDMGHECVVICPRKTPGEKRIPGDFEIQHTAQGKEVKVYFPKYICTWLTARFKNDLLRDWSFNNFFKAVDKTIRENNIQFDVVYSQFLGVASWCSVKIAKKYGKCSFSDAGESRYRFLEDRIKERGFTIKYLTELDGIVSVSTENKDLLIDNGILNDSKICVFPNGIDSSHFYPRDKHESRKKFGFSDSDFIVSFVGYFIDRKGPLRVEAATKDLAVKVAYAGKGPDEPMSPNTVWKAPVKPENIPEFLSAGDIFVLPTLNEGCCNAIIEAMACGLPVVSSDLKFNFDILDDSCSIRINPGSVDEIKAAVEKLLNDSELRNKLSMGAALKGKSLSLHNRAQNILEWISSIIEVK